MATFKAIVEGEGVTFPDQGERIIVLEEYPTRWVGEDTEYTVPAGATGVVMGNWVECCDTHVRLDQDGAEVWVCPLHLTLEESDVLYHGTNTSPEFTAQHGLVPSPGLSDEGMLGEGVTHAVFMTPDADEAAGYGRHVYRVDGRGLDLEKVDGPDGYHYVTLTPVSPDRLQKHEGAAPDARPNLGPRRPS